VEEAAAPACVLDDQGRVLAANRALELLLGVGASGGLCGRTLASLAYPPDEELAQAAVQQVLVEGLDRCQVDARWVRIYSRELVWAAFDLSLVRDRRGRPELAIAMVRDLTAMKRSEHERRFFEFMFKLIGEADSSHEVLTAAVQTICHFTRCGMGQVWLPAGNVLVCSPSWYCSGYGFEKLHVASEEIDYRLGEGVPGLAWAKRQPLLLEDIRQSGRFDRAVAAQRAGVREAMAVPVTGADGVVAVLELFVTHERAGEPGRLERIARVAEELGPLVERRRAEEALAASQRRFQAVTEAAVDAIVSADSSGRLLTWNSGAERLFGWTAGPTWSWWSRGRSAPTGAWSCRSATTAAASRPSTASACSESSSAWKARRPAPGPGSGWPSAARSSRSSAAASASRATPGPTSGSCSRPRWRPAGPPRS
jgi:PAS domain S-box-containing protein